MNNFFGIGRVTKDINLMYTSSNIEVVKFTLAINRNYKNANGEYEADFIQCVAFKQKAKLLNNYVKKGDIIGIDGRIQTRNYDDKNGKKVYVTEIVVNEIQLLEPKKAEQKQNSEVIKNTSKEEYDELAITDDDLPF